MIDLDAPLVAQPLPKSGLLKIVHSFGRRTFVEVTTWQRCHAERRVGGFSAGALQFIERHLHKHARPIGEVPASRFNDDKVAGIAAIEADAIETSLDPPMLVETCVT